MRGDLTQRRDWEDEIRRRAGSLRHRLVWMGGILLLVVLLLAVILGGLALLTTSGSIAVLGLSLTREAIGLMTIVAGLLDVLLGANLLSGIRGLLAPAHTRYRRYAFEIIDELVAGRYVGGRAMPRLSATQARDLRQIAYDLPQDFDNAAQADETLQTICFRLAERMRLWDESQ